MQTCLTGIFPRSEDLIAATRGYDRGRVARDELEATLRGDVEAVVALQTEAGCALLMDGMLSWQDLFRPLVDGWQGLSPGGLQRWFDNNTFFRQPVVHDDVVAAPLPDAHLRADSLPDAAGHKAVLPGPYTFARLADDRHYGRGEDLLGALGNALAEACRDLSARGVGHVQLSEPSLAVDPPDRDGWDAVRQAYDALRSAGDQGLALHLFFAPVGAALPELLDLPVNVLGIDLYEEDLDVLAEVDFDRVLACGCVDARNSLLEAPEEIAEQAAQARDLLAPTDLLLCPNADLEFLPRPVAEAKVRALGEAASLLEARG